MTHTIRYDLRREPWICCEKRDGSRVLLGIAEVLTQAHEIASVHHESPLVTAAVHRILLAILQRVFAPRTMADWVKLWNRPAFEAAPIISYLERWHARFDLFDVERPFLQVGRLREVLRRERGKEPEPTEAWRLALETSAHSNATQLFEPLPAEPALLPQEAAAALLGFLAFAPGGRIQNETASWDAAPLRAGAVILIRGDTLQRTLLLNLVWQHERKAEDVPPWERDVPAERETRAPFGLIDQLVWQSRRVQLMPEREPSGAIVVRRVLTAAGAQFDVEHPDPMFAYVVRDPKAPPMPVRIDPDRSVWRDANALFEAGSGASQFGRPRACTQLGELVREGIVPRSARLRFEVLGMAGKQAAIRLWRSDRLDLPPALLIDGERVSILRSALELSEKFGAELNTKVLRVLAEAALAPGEREAHSKDIANLRNALGGMASFWGALGQAFGPWLGGLVTAATPDDVLAEWKATLRLSARRVVEQTELRLGSSARALQAGVKARRALRRIERDLLGSEIEAAATPAMAEGDSA